MSMVNIVINGIDLQVPKGTTVLDAAKQVGVHIPTLCHLDLHDFGVVNKVASCRVCVVEVQGRAALAPSCAEMVQVGYGSQRCNRLVLVPCSLQPPTPLGKVPRDYQNDQ